MVKGKYEKENTVWGRYILLNTDTDGTLFGTVD